MNNNDNHNDDIDSNMLILVIIVILLVILVYASNHAHTFLRQGRPVAADHGRAGDLRAAEGAEADAEAPRAAPHSMIRYNLI